MRRLLKLIQKYRARKKLEKLYTAFYALRAHVDLMGEIGPGDLPLNMKAKVFAQSRPETVETLLLAEDEILRLEGLLEIDKERPCEEGRTIVSTSLTDCLLRDRREKRVVH